MAAAVFRRRIDFRGPADLDLVIADKRPADERRARMTAAIAAMTKGMMLHRGAHRIADFAAMALAAGAWGFFGHRRSEEHTSELQSLMRISYAVFCLKKKKHKKTNTHTYYHR